jgi:hypothetical protein
VKRAARRKGERFIAVADRDGRPTRSRERRKKKGSGDDYGGVPNSQCSFGIGLGRIKLNWFDLC